MGSSPGDASQPETVYEVHCRECDWGADDPLELKGEANLRAGRHISETGHVVVLKTVTRDDPDGEFRRGRRVTFERLRRVPGDDADERRTCGSVDVVDAG